MDVDFRERETLFPSNLLTDDNIFSENQNKNHHGSGSESVLNSYGSFGSSSSGLDTPVGSEFDSTETDSDEDDFMAELTRQMADYMLQEDDENAAPNEGSENSKSFGSSEKWPDLNSGSKYNHSQGTTGKPPSTGFYSNPAFTDERIQPIQFHQLRNQHQMKHRGCEGRGRGEKMAESTQQLEPERKLSHTKHHRMQNRGRASEFGNAGRVRPLGSSQVGSGMRAIFLGGTGSRTASCGTGVFLPRGTDIAPDQTRKKIGCSTVLMPARVLQALNIHFKNMDALSQSNGCAGFTGYPHQQARGGQYTQEKQQLQPQAGLAMNQQEMQLPQEWTY